MALSLRARILLGITLPSVAILLASTVSVHLGTRMQRIAHLDSSLQTRAAAMAALVELEHGDFDVDFDSAAVPAAELFGPLTTYEVRAVENGRILARRAPADAPAFAVDTGPLPTPQALAALPSDRPYLIQGGAAERVSGGRRFRQWSGTWLVRADESDEPGAAPAPADGPKFPVVHIVVVQDLSGVSAELSSLLLVQAVVGISLSVLAVLSGWLLSRRIVDPIEAIARRAEEVRAPSPEPPLALAGTRDEIDRLAESLNRSYARLHDAYVHQARFTADASHELRTPLAVIRAQAEVALRRNREVSEYEAALASVVTGASRMQETLEALLVLARVDAGVWDRPPEPVDLGTLAREVVQSFTPLGHALSVRVEGKGEPVVAGDGRQLEVVLRNLLSNALRHTPPSGEVMVRVRPDEDRLLLEVRDTGEGIPPTALPHIFERFFRVDDARSRARGGSGLGLSIVKVVVERHGGTVHAESAPGRGTTVQVWLPRLRAGTIHRASA